LRAVWRSEILQILRFALEVDCKICDGASSSAVQAFWLRLKMPKACRLRGIVEIPGFIRLDF
jgi:hypothetical protein